MTNGSTRTFQLLNGTELIGTLREYELDQPWIHCKFQPTAGFLAFKSLFDKDLELHKIGDWEESDKIIEQIETHLRLVDVDDPELIGKFLLHIQNDEAWFRFMTKAESENWSEE